MMYHNNGDGTFTPAADIGDLATANHGIDEGSIVSFADYDNDGWMDVVIGGNGSSEALYHNNHDGTFSDVTTAAGFTPKNNTQGLAWGDYDNDGLLDLYISRGKATGGGILGNSLYRNNGDGTFTDMTDEAQVDDNTNTWGAVWGDYDNDGFLDLFVARPGTKEIGVGNANLLYHNNGDGTFTDVAVQEGVALQDDTITSAHKLAAWGDYNDDGYLDLVVKDGISPGLITGDAFKGLHYLFKNSGGTNHYIKLNLHGVQSNLRGIGARVTVIHDGLIAFRQNNGGGGGEWGSQGDGPMHFGIGTSATATVRIAWPSGLVDILSDVAADSTLTVTEGSFPASVQSLNVSTRLEVGTGDKVSIGGIIVTAGDQKRVLLRAIGPSLTAFGVTDALADPVLELHAGDGTLITSNDNWKDSPQMADIQATGLAPTNDLESAILTTLSPGLYTAVVNGKDGVTGVGLVEAYDLDQGAASQLGNLSTRGFVETGDKLMIGGFILGPDEAQNASVLVRAIGPSLAAFGVTDALADPVLELHDANGMVLMRNDNWKETQQTEIEATGLQPTNDLESAILMSLPPSSYTAVVSGSGGSTGVALVEVYRLP